MCFSNNPKGDPDASFEDVSTKPSRAMSLNPSFTSFPAAKAPNTSTTSAFTSPLSSHGNSDATKQRFASRKACSTTGHSSSGLEIDADGRYSLEEHERERALEDGKKLTH
jgi:hypothetical protein